MAGKGWDSLNMVKLRKERVYKITINFMSFVKFISPTLISFQVVHNVFLIKKKFPKF